MCALFEKVCHTRLPALQAHGPCPFYRHWPVTRPALAALDDPGDAREVQLQRPKGGLITHETHHGRDSPEMVRPPDVVLVLDAGSEPNIRPASAPISREVGGDALRPLRQKLPVQVRRLADQVPEPEPDGIGNGVLLEHVAERAGEDAQALAGDPGLAVEGEGLAPVGHAGYLAARSTLVGYVHESENPYFEQTAVHIACKRKEYAGLDWYNYGLKLLEIAHKVPDSVFHIWGHSYEIEQNKQWPILDLFLKEMTR